MLAPLKFCIPAVFLALTVGLAAFFMYCFQPEPYVRPVTPFSDYDKQAMFDAVSTKNVASDIATIDGFGSRFIGQPGFEKTAGFIRDAYTSAGLEIQELKVKSAVPVTLERRCLGAGGQPL